MRELIDRQAALDVLCDACGNCACPTGKIPRCSYYEKMQAIPAASPWHRVEEEMPPDNRFVLVCNDDHRYGVAQYVGDDGLTPWQIAYCLYDVDLWDDEEQGPVRYWMPIEPPKEEK